ncbi:MAG: hypothetical protein ACI9UD_003165, partial [Glaciecola sp.]
DIAPVLSLSVSDAPVENTMQVVACFSEIELKAVNNSNDQSLMIGLDTNTTTANDLCTDAQGTVIPNTRGIDLLSLSGIDSEELLSGVEISAGEYTQIRLSISEGSYALVDMDNDGIADDVDQDGNPDKIPVRVPSNELKLDGFTATAGARTDLTVEFDLRKGMTNPVGQSGYILKPRGVRIVDNSVSGHIQGTVSEVLLSDNMCNITPTDLTESVASVYLYEGVDLDPTTLADNGGSEGQEALTSAAVLYDGAGNYNFEIGFVAAASYTLSLTCDEDSDPEGDDELVFIINQELTVSEQGQITQVSFPQ